jgi:hypothetical protein
MPVETKMLFTFWVAANSRFLNHSFSVWFAESAGSVAPVGALNFKYPAAPWAFKHNLSGCSCWFVWRERNCGIIQR